MPKIRFIRGVVWNEVGRGPGEVVEVNDREARILCDGYKDAVRVDGTESPVLTSMTVREQVETSDPVVAHRDPVTQPSKRRS